MLLEAKNLNVSYRRDGKEIHAVHDLNLTIETNEVFGVVGESGCGKSTLIKGLLRLLASNGRIRADSIVFDGLDIQNMSAEEFRSEILWKRISLVPQSAMNSLNPVYKVGDQIVEVIQEHSGMTVAEARIRVAELLESVGLQAELANSYPHQFSGGMRQRAMIAMSLALNPKLIIMDEPTTGLDVLVQDKILRTLADVRHQYNCSILLISHDIAIMSELASRIGVMYAGSFVEIAQTDDIFHHPSHPYTMGLTNAFPSIRDLDRELISIPGSPPVIDSDEPKCWFNQRCPFALDACSRITPEETNLQNSHRVSCLRFEERVELADKAKRKATWIS